MKVDFRISGQKKLNKAIQALEKVQEELEGPLLVDTAEKVSEHIAARGKANAPERTGNLRSNIQAATVTLKNGIAHGTVFVPNSVVYATLMHEHLVPYGMPLGTNSSGFPLFSLDYTLVLHPNTTTAEGKIGGMFISRVAAYHMRQYEKQLRQNLESILRKRKVRTYRFYP